MNKARLLNPRWWIAVLLILFATGTALYLNYHYDWVKHIHLHIASYHWLIVFVLVATLPVFGFSIVICYMIVGSKFGAGWGMFVVLLATAAHLLGTHWITTSFLRQRVLGFMVKRGYKIPHVPKGENASVALMTAIIPGLPYFVRNYLLALSGIPLKTYFLVCLPVYVVRSVLTIFAADFSEAITGRKALVLAGIFLLKVGICAYIVKRLRDKYPRDRKAASGVSA